MTMVPVTTVTTTAATTAAAAAAHQRELEKEEEQMTKYRADEIEEWEFKIVRASTKKFKNPEFLRKVREEEAMSGWEMLEKFDDYRVRFRRKIEHRGGDLHREIDPYRTTVGASSGKMEAWMVAIGVAIALLGVAAALFFTLGVRAP